MLIHPGGYGAMKHLLAGLTLLLSSAALATPTVWKWDHAELFDVNEINQVDARELMGPSSGTDAAKNDPKSRSPCGTGMWRGPAFGFAEACEAHDRCYAICGADRLSCDEKFEEDVNASCPSAVMSCSILASTYTGLVRFGGHFWPYEAAQRAACAARAGCILK